MSSTVSAFPYHGDEGHTSFPDRPSLLQCHHEPPDDHVQFQVLVIARVIISEESIDEFVSHGLTESLEGHPSLKGRPTSETWIYGKLSDKVDKILNDENFISKLEKGLLKESIQVYKDQFSDEKEWFKDLIENKLDEVFESFKDSLKNLL